MASSIAPNAFLLFDGRRVAGKVTCANGGTLLDCPGDRVKLRLGRVPKPGMHLLQVANAGGLTSNEVLIFVGE